MPETKAQVTSAIAELPTALPAPIAALLPHASERSYRRRTIILSEGDSGDTMVILLEGSVRVFGEDGSGKEVTYGHIDAPSYFGEMSLDGGPRSASIEALTPCKCAIVTRERLRAQLANQPELAWELITKIISRARSATDTVRNMALLDAYSRLRHVLHELSTPADDHGWRKLVSGTTHAALAKRIGTSREMVSKIWRDLEAGEHACTQGRALYIKNDLPTRW